MATPNKLKKLRCMQGISQAAAAAVAGVPQIVYERWESDGLPINDQHAAVRLAEFYGVSVEYLRGVTMFVPHAEAA